MLKLQCLKCSISAENAICFACGEILKYIPCLLLYTSNLLYYIITAWHIPDAVCTVLELLMMGGETARNM